MKVIVAAVSANINVKAKVKRATGVVFLASVQKNNEQIGGG